MKMNDGKVILAFERIRALLEEDAPDVAVRAGFDGVYLYRRGQRDPVFWSPRIGEVEAFVRGGLELRGQRGPSATDDE